MWVTVRAIDALLVAHGHPIPPEILSILGGIDRRERYYKRMWRISSTRVLDLRRYGDFIASFYKELRTTVESKNECGKHGIGETTSRSKR